MIRSNARRLTAAAILVGVGAVAAGCVTSSSQTPRMAAVQPMVSVERFLQAANTGDLEAMAYIFGTADGPIAEQTGGAFSCAFRRIGSWIRVSDRCRSWVDIELHMNLIAVILRHDVYRVSNEAGVPGRARPTIRIGVDLNHGVARHVDVPFLVVQARDGRWLVEEIGLAQITQGE